MKSAMIFPCGVSKAQNTRRPRRELEDIGGDKAVEKIPCAVAGDLDHTAVREEGSLHAMMGKPAAE